jgi:hypothetical protein
MMVHENDGGFFSYLILMKGRRGNSGRNLVVSTVLLHDAIEQLLESQEVEWP